MATLPEQITQAGRNQFLAQLEFFGSLADAALDNARRVADMQLRAGRATFNRSSEAMRQLLDMREPRDVPVAGFSAARVEDVFEYGREIFSIMTGMSLAPPSPLRDINPVPASAVQPQRPGGASREWPASQAEAGQPAQTGETQPEVQEAPRASQADAGRGPDTGTTDSPRQQSAQADDSGSDIPPADPKQMEAIIDHPSVGLPPAEGPLTPIADAVGKTVGKKPATKK